MGKVIPADSPQALEKAMKAILSGGVVAFPTDTVYGIGASAREPQAVARLYASKGRPAGKAIPLLLAKALDLATVARDIPPVAWSLAERFWPGALTLVVPKREEISPLVSAGQDTIAVRVPAHSLALALIEKVALPLATTSANLSSQAPALTAQEVERELVETLDLILDGGRAPGGVPSTVLDLTRQVPTILRLGAISAQELAGVLGRQPALATNLK